MDRMRFSTLAHSGHLYCSPLFADTVDGLIDRLDLGRGARVLDVGCGKAEMLIRIVERSGATGVGVDPNPAFLAEARARAAGRVPDGSLALHATTLADAPLAAHTFDAALCVGSIHAFGTYEDALHGLAALVRPGGVIVAGEGYWKRHPDPAYLAVLGGSEDEFTSHDRNLERGAALGLEPRFSIASSDAEWDAYEGMYSRAIERFAAEHPDDPDRDAMLERIRAWNAAFHRWGRDTLGFGIYVFASPAA